MKGSEKQIIWSKSIVAEMEQLMEEKNRKNTKRIEKIISKEKSADDFIKRNECSNHYTSMIKKIVIECDNAEKIIDSRDEILKSARNGGNNVLWAGIAFLVGGISRTEINSGKYAYKG